MVLFCRSINDVNFEIPDNLITDLLEIVFCLSTAFLPNVYIGILLINAAILTVFSTMAKGHNMSEEETLEAALTLCAKIWRAYCQLYHGQEFTGLENIPSSGPAMVVYYHGTMPIDYCGLLAEIWLKKNRVCGSVIDRYSSNKFHKN